MLCSLFLFISVYSRWVSVCSALCVYYWITFKSNSFIVIFFPSCDNRSRVVHLYPSSDDCKMNMKCRSRKKYSRKDTQRQALKTKEKSSLNSHNINFWKNNYLVPCCEVIIPKHILSIQKQRINYHKRSTSPTNWDTRIPQGSVNL